MLFRSRGMNFIKYVKYALLTIATILVTAISVLLAAVIIEMITWNEAGKWIIAFFELAGISLLLSIIWIAIGTTIAKDSKKTDKK